MTFHDIPGMSRRPAATGAALPARSGAAISACTMLRCLYDGTMRLAGHPHAVWLLAAVAFAESVVFPVPVDALLIPMVLAAPERAWRYAAVCTGASVAGGAAGYGIGAFLFQAVGAPVLEFYDYGEAFAEAQALYNAHGGLIVFTAAFSPIPYKVFTIASGVAGTDLGTFVLASAAGRGLRFFIVAALLWRFGAPLRAFIERRLGPLALAFAVLLVAGFVLVKVL